MRKQQGFTLLELVVAMTLTAMLLGMLSAGLYSVVNDWKRDSTILDSGLDQALTVLQLDRALQAAYPHTYIDTKRLSRFVYFQGDEESLSFISTVSPQRQSGLMTWQLSSNNQDGVQLKLTPAFSDDPTERLNTLTTVKLLPNYSLELRYLVQKNPEEKEWVEEWDGTVRQSLPIAVHVKLKPLHDNDSEKVLEIVAPIRAWRSPLIEPVVPPV